MYTCIHAPQHTRPFPLPIGIQRSWLNAAYTTSTSNSAATSATCVSEHFYIPVSVSARVDGRSNAPRKWRWQLAWNGHHAPRHDSYARSQSICLSEYSLRRDMMHMDSCGPAYNLSSYRVIRAGALPSKPIAASSVAPPAEEPEVPSSSARGRSPEGSSVALWDRASGRTQQFCAQLLRNCPSDV